MNVWYCKSCGYRGPRHAYSFLKIVLIGFFLLFAAIPGILYAIYLESWRKCCPKCDQKSLIPADSPEARRATTPSQSSSIEKEQPAKEISPQNKKAKNLPIIQGALCLLLFGVIAWFLGGGLGHQSAEQQVKEEMRKIENQVAADAVNQYNIAKRQGDAIQICVQAGMVSAAYLQAQDEANYQKWKSVEKEDCRRAGLP